MSDLEWVLPLQLMDNAQQYSGRSEHEKPKKGFDWRSFLRIRWRRDDKESIICYFLFMALFVADFSILALVFPAALYCYALLAQTPVRHFWQVCTSAIPCSCQAPRIPISAYSNLHHSPTHSH